MKYFSLTQFVDYCLEKMPDCEAVQVCVNTKSAKTNQFNQQQLQPALIRMNKRSKGEKYTYTEFADKYLSGEDWTLSIKIPPKCLPEEWLVVNLDTVKRTCDTFEGHYYSRSFRKLDERNVPEAKKALDNIKTMSEIQLDEDAIYF